jgi:uncharacterized protein YigE (DUF2233 family)
VRKLSAAIAALCALSFCEIATAQWKVVSCEKQGAASGVVHVRTAVEGIANADTAELHLAIFNLKSVSLRVIDQPNEPRSDLATVMARDNCVAGVNGGYFDPEYLPVGLLVVDSQTIAPLRKAKLLTGVLTVSGANIQLLRASEVSSRRKCSAALQCGPFLVDRAQPIAGLNDTRAARRTFVAVGAQDRAAIGYCSSVTLAGLANILSSSGIAPEMKVTRAMNLDGGSSSAFWFRGDFSIPEQKTVRTFVAITAR